MNCQFGFFLAGARSYLDRAVSSEFTRRSSPCVGWSPRKFRPSSILFFFSSSETGLIESKFIQFLLGYKSKAPHHLENELLIQRKRELPMLWWRRFMWTVKIPCASPRYSFIFDYRRYRLRIGSLMCPIYLSRSQNSHATRRMET